LARFTSPLAHEAPIAAPRAEYAGAIAETAAGDWLVSARLGRRALCAQAVEAGAAAMQTVLAQSGEDLAEPVLVAPRARPSTTPPGCTIGVMPT